MTQHCLGIFALTKTGETAYTIDMKNKIAFLTLVSGFVLSMGCGLVFAANSPTLDMLKGSNGIPNYDNTAAKKEAAAAVNTRAADSTSSTTQVGSPPLVDTTPPVVTPPTPPKPNLIERMGTDVKENKLNYAMAGAAGALTGYFLMGAVMSGAVLGLGIMLVFLLLLRNVQ